MGVRVLPPERKQTETPVRPGSRRVPDGSQRRPWVPAARVPAAGVPAAGVPAAGRPHRRQSTTPP
ncbi:MAG: hypothetical protein D6683_07735 [Actinomyces sp.]|nr:MAG: hypothetical protein D6683_07735 [Actinomyces sp.]